MVLQQALGCLLAGVLVCNERSVSICLVSEYMQLDDILSIAVRARCRKFVLCPERDYVCLCLCVMRVLGRALTRA